MRWLTQTPPAPPRTSPAQADPKYELPAPRKPPSGPDWGKVSRWSFLGAFVLLVWLLYPTAQCSWGKFRDTPMSTELEDSEFDAWRADEERINGAENFFERWYLATEICYAKTPLMGQSPWKGKLMVFLFIIAVISRVVDSRWRRKRRQYS